MAEIDVFPFCCIIPPYIQQAIAQRGAAAQSARAKQNLSACSLLRGHRATAQAVPLPPPPPPGQKRRVVYDSKGQGNNPPTGTVARQEGGGAVGDPAVNEAYDGCGATYDLFYEVYGRHSIDGKGMALASFVHYGLQLDNAFWDGHQMVYGNGDPVLFNHFTKCIDVIAHELSHGIIQHTANLEYLNESGALNESFADVFGSLVKQRALNQTAAEADWLIGVRLLKPKIKGDALRSLKAPGTAFNDAMLGQDPQPGHMDDYLHTTQDNGGVHTNSGIPNRAFHLAATAIGGYAWEKAGRIWYDALCNHLHSKSGFKDAAEATLAAADTLYGGGPERHAVLCAWQTVGVL